ncbi:hypothetical protein ACFYZ9_31070 [Streptomyces sp. NPDC001691]|uniref:hypothetical protein n=1 Tax=unclassified Streptomyces TaxID=2593676 RepID=UPI0011C06D8B|nr:hypothetical protein [Streptomyces sp. SDr-06]
MPFAPRVIARVLLVTAAVLLAWTVVLGFWLDGQTQVRNWSVSWVGMDLLQATGLVATAVLLARQVRTVSPVASATAALLVLDAWFDVATSEDGGAQYVALGMAFLVELPAALWLAWLAAFALDWAAPSRTTKGRDPA